MSEAKCPKCEGTGYKSKERLEDGSYLFAACECWIDADKLKKLCEKLNDQD